MFVATILAYAAMAQTAPNVLNPNDASMIAGCAGVANAGNYYYPGEPLATNEMRISFMGTSFLPRLSQAANSVFVECGNGENFVFDCGSGVIEKYVAMGVAYSRMDKIFLTHLHGDHMSDLMFIYCFGPSTDRKTPLQVWGPTGDSTNEGVSYFCDTTKAITEWHRESFSFLSTGLTNGLDGYDLVAHECPYTLIDNVVYNTNGVRITHFPAIHDRNGAISFRLEWQGIAMVFSGDSQPNTFMLNQATNLDVLIHEVTLPPELWAIKNGSGLLPTDPTYPAGVALAKKIQDCSHTPAKALGYMLNQLSLSNVAPRLAVATHCQFEEDTTNTIMTGIRSWYPGPVALVSDLQVLNISTDKSQPIRQRTAIVSSDAFYTNAAYYAASEIAAPKYANNMMQLSDWLQAHIIPEASYTNPPISLAARSAAVPDKPVLPNPARAAGAENTGFVFNLGEAPATNEMRISFMGTSFLPRLSQAANSVFVECGNGENFVFDCGAGVVEKFVAAGVAYSQMDKILLTHLHADHMSDLMFIYCFGPSTDRYTPVSVWGPTGPSTNAPQGAQPNEGVTNFCAITRAMTKWHRESFSFLSTGLTNGQDGYDLVPYECPYELIGNQVYNSNGVRITHFPAIHDRDGAISFRLEWQGLSMVFSGDTRPNTFMLNQATNLDVLIHEVTLSPEVWAAKNTGRGPGDPIYSNAVITARTVQDCSHTPAKALGYMLNQLALSNAAPRLAVATHCQFEDDTTNAVMTDINSWYTGPVVLVKDLQVISISTDKSQPIRQGVAASSSNAFYAHKKFYSASQLAPPEYTNNLMQLSAWLLDHVIPARLYSTLYTGVDYNSDGKSDLAVYRDGVWQIYLMAGGILEGGWGWPGWIPVSGDYDGDRKSDLVVYRDGYWYIYLMAGGTLEGGWGAAGWTPAQGDYDGDRKSDLAVYRDGAWQIYLMAGDTLEGGWGAAGWIPVSGDYDGDGKSDLAVYHNGYWQIYLMAGVILEGGWGWPGWTPMSGDYDGDGKSDLAVYRDGYWHIYLMTGRSIEGGWGWPGWTPVSGDYDGDGKSDLAVYRDGYWYIYLMAGSVLEGGWGAPCWIPVR